MRVTENRLCLLVVFYTNGSKHSHWELGVGRCLFSGSVYRRNRAQTWGHHRRGRGQERDQQIRDIEATLIGGAQHTGEDLLTLRAVGGSIPAAAHLARDDGRTQGVFGAPIGGVEGRVKQKAEDGVEFDDEVALKPAHAQTPSRTRRSSPVQPASRRP